MAFQRPVTFFENFGLTREPKRLTPTKTPCAARIIRVLVTKTESHRNNTLRVKRRDRAENRKKESDSHLALTMVPHQILRE